MLYLQVLRSPVQTFCGHRFCQQCLINKLGEDDPLKCPMGEEDCELLTLRVQNPEQRNVCLANSTCILIMYVSREVKL
jgi:hypothetical protein